MAEERKQRENRNRKGAQWETGLIATLILLLFRIPLTKIIGNEGNGYLAISWEIYSIFYLFFGYGYSKVVGSMVETRVNKGLYRNSIKAFKTIFFTGLFSSLLGMVLILVLAGWFSEFFFHTNMVEISLKLFAPLLILHCITEIFRGYFEGMSSRVPTLISRLVEAIITATGAFIFAFVAGNHGAKVGALLHNPHFEAGFFAAGVACGFLCGGVLSCLFLAFVYTMYQKAYNRLLKKDMTRVLERKSGLLRTAFLAFPPILLEVFAIKLYRLINLLIYSHYQLKGENHVAKIEVIGSFYGKISVLMAIAIILILFLVEERKKKNRRPVSQYEFKNGKQFLADQLERLFALALPVMATFMVLSQIVLRMLYQSASQTDSLLLGIGGATVLFASLGVYLSRILLSLQMKKQLIILSFIAFILPLPIVVALNRLEMQASLPLADLSLGIGELIFWLIFSAGQIICFLKLYPMRLPWGRMVLVPVIQASVMALVELLFIQLLKNALPAWLLCILAITVGTIFHQLTKKVPLLNLE